DAGDASVNAFGADATIDLFAGFNLTGFYHSASINGTVVDDLDSGVDEDETVVVADLDRDNNYATEFGVKLAHDGSAENALIPGLNLSASYTQSEADFSKTTIAADADFSLSVSVLTLTPYASYETVTDTDIDVTSEDTSEIKVGTGLETAQLDIITKPSLVGAVNYRTKSHTDLGSGDPEFTATEMQYSVGLQLNEFLFENSVLTARYGSWTGTNVSASFDPPGFADDNATNISAGDVDNGLTQSASGYEITWTYFGLEFAYGAYDSVAADAAGAEAPSAGQAFSISYTIDF
ncbi:MAG TPA: hypothetical protein VF171_02875, partial [Trueperaceae bacterium]